VGWSRSAAVRLPTAPTGYRRDELRARSLAATDASSAYSRSVGVRDDPRFRWAAEPKRVRHNRAIASYVVNERAVARARQLIESRQYVLDSDWGDVQPDADVQNAYLKSHSWEDYAEWHLGLREGAREGTKARYGFVYRDFRRLHRSGVIACLDRAAEWRHKQVERAAYDLLQVLDERSG